MQTKAIDEKVTITVDADDMKLVEKCVEHMNMNHLETGERKWAIWDVIDISFKLGLKDMLEYHEIDSDNPFPFA